MKRLRQWVFWGLLILLGSVMLIQGLTGKSVQAEIKKLPDSKVAIVQSKQSEAADIQYEEIRAMIREAVNLAGGFPELVKDNSTVVIKPNLVQSYDNTLPGWRGRPLSTEANGVTTDWRVTKAVVELVREYNPHGKVYVMEGSAGPTKPVMNDLNYTPKYIPGVDAFLAIEDDSGSWHDTKSKGLVKVKLPNGLIHKEYYLNKKYKEADVVISLPTLKNHWHAAVTGGIKNVGIGATPANIYGSSPNNPLRINMFNHESGEIHKWLHDFYLCRPVDYVIMDGLQGIQNGPTPSYEVSKTTNIKQDQMNMRLILAGKDPIAVDTIESLVIGWDPQSVGYLRNLNNSGAGNLDTACIDVVGKPVDQVRKYFAGVTPPGGGEKITDKTGPTFKVKQAEIQSGELLLQSEPDAEIVKIELYLDDKRLEPVTHDFNKISIKVGPKDEGKHQLKIYAYDRFLNCTEQALDVTTKTETNTNPVSDGNYQAPQAGTAPTIDGLGNESCWGKAEWREIKYLWLGLQPSPEDFSGRYKIVWTPERLYYLVEITDDRLTDVYSDPLTDYYKDDCLEFFLDEDHSGGIHTTNYNAFAYHIALDYNVVDTGKNGQPRLFNDHVSVKRTKNGNVYTWEAAVKVFDDKFNEKSDANQPVTLISGKKLGFAIAYCDNDDSVDRQSFIGSIDIPGINKNVAYINASVFGTLTLE